jgi:Domain of unknown function (DUF4157)
MRHALLSRQSDNAQPSKLKTTSSGLRISQPGDAFEREADRVAATVGSGQRIKPGMVGALKAKGIHRDPTPPDPQTDAKTAPKPNNYDDAISKVAEAFLKTQVGQQMVKHFTDDDPLVKDVSNFIKTPGGIVAVGAAATGVIATLAATHKPLPAQLPAIPLDMISSRLAGLKVQISYEGPVDHPTQAMLTLSYEGKSHDKKKKVSDSDKFRAETARMAADQDKFRAGMQPKTGAEADQQKKESQMIQDWSLRRAGTIPGADHNWDLSQMGKNYPRYDLHMRGAGTTNDEVKKEEIPVQRKATSDAEVVGDGAEVDEALHSTSHSLDPETRSYMESRIGFDFSKVRIHTDARAASSARALNARAYTVGNDVVFGSGRYAPETFAGKRLLAHELTHTVQQAQEAPSSAPPSRGKPFKQDEQTAAKGDELRSETDGSEGPRTGFIPLQQAASNLQKARDKRLGSVLSKGPIHFRVPTSSDLKKLFSAGTVPESALKAGVELALTRMAKEGHLKTKDSVSVVMAKIFPSAGVFDEAAYRKAVDVTDRRKVYQSVLDAETKVTSADKPKLKTTMEDAAKLIDTAAADDADLVSVFGSLKSRAKAVYVKAKTALKRAIAHIDTTVTTDYNLDDPETGLGGWASFSDQKVHFESSVAQVKDKDDAEVTIIHESCHLASDAVVDQGHYYGSSGFESLAEARKVTNAAHYEEIPWRKLKKSKYQRKDGSFIDFKPGVSTAGTSETFESKAKSKANEYLTHAWDKAVDVDTFFRDIRVAQLAGNKAPFNKSRARILQLSKLMHLTVHEQPAATACVNQVDVVLAEGIARGTAIILSNSASQKAPSNAFELHVPSQTPHFEPGHSHVMNQKLHLKPMPGASLSPHSNLGTLVSVDSAAKQVIENSIKAYGALTGNLSDDKKLMDWLVAEYKKPI